VPPPFDTVDYDNDILLSLREHRLNGTALDWFRSYLTERIQSFVFAGKQTVAYQVDCSVPQGSVLGPFGFVAYTYDITDTIQQHDVSPHLHADDTKLRASSKPEDVPAMRQQLWKLRH